MDLTSLLSQKTQGISFDVCHVICYIDFVGHFSVSNIPPLLFHWMIHQLIRVVKNSLLNFSLFFLVFPYDELYTDYFINSFSLDEFFVFPYLLIITVLRKQDKLFLDLLNQKTSSKEVITSWSIELQIISIEFITQARLYFLEHLLFTLSITLSITL